MTITDSIKDAFLEDKEVPDRISDQHILMLKLKEIAQLSAVADIAPIFRAPSGNQANESAKTLRNRRFNNLYVLDYDKPYGIPNLLLNNEKEIGTMLKLTTLQLSLLLPRIRIYKIMFDRSTNTEVKIELPFDDVASSEDIERIFANGVGRGSGTGIKSFEWKSMAQNQANLFQFSATLSLFIQNIEEMQQIRNSIEHQGKTLYVSILDLLYAKPSLRNGLNEGSNIYDQNYFGIKVEVGWHIDPANAEIFKAESIKYNDNGQKIYEAIQEQKNIYYLTLVTHKFDFNEDGSITLDIDYIASAEMEASDSVKANILRLSDESEIALKDAQIKLKNANEALKHLKKNNSSNQNSVSNDTDNTQYLTDVPMLQKQETNNQEANNDKLKEDRDSALEEIEKLKKNQKIEKMQSIVRTLLYRNLINILYIPTEDYNILTSLQSQTLETVSDADFISQQIKTAKNNIQIVPQNSLNWSADEAISLTNEIGDNTDAILKATPGLESVSKDGKPAEENQKISFFLLGDLLDTVLKHIFNPDNEPSGASSFITKTNRILLGPITYYDFGSIEDSGVVMRDKGAKTAEGEVYSVYRGKQSIVNLADIPISVNEFSKWFVRTIINPGKEIMSFLDFSRALIDDLVITALSSDGFKFAPSQQIRVNLLPFSAPKSSNEDIFRSIVESGNQPTKSFRFNLKAERNFGGSDNTLKPFMNLNVNADKQNYILFYGVNQPPLERIAEEQADLKEKIFHIYIGEERGIIKKASFSRDDNPRIRANNIQLSNPEKYQDGMIIREKYSGTFEFFGNFLFQPGQQLFVHPTYPGLKGRNVRDNLYRQLGLGGYYFILEVNSRILNGEFTTTIRTKWNAFGDGKLNIGDVLNADVVETDFLSTGQSLIDEGSRNVKLVTG